MKDELRTELTDLADRVSMLECQVAETDEPVFDYVMKAKPGDCPAKFSATWKNRKVEFKVCAAAAAAAEREANRRRNEEIQKMVRKAAGLDCDKRPGCAAPATCKEKWSGGKIAQLGNWACVDSTEKGGCDDGETEWTCTGWFDIELTLRCKCER